MSSPTNIETIGRRRFVAAETMIVARGGDAAILSRS